MTKWCHNNNPQIPRHPVWRCVTVNSRMSLQCIVRTSNEWVSQLSVMRVFSSATSLNLRSHVAVSAFSLSSTHSIGESNFAYSVICQPSPVKFRRFRKHVKLFYVTQYLLAFGDYRGRESKSSSDYVGIKKGEDDLQRLSAKGNLQLSIDSCTDGLLAIMTVDPYRLWPLHSKK